MILGYSLFELIVIHWHVLTCLFVVLIAMVVIAFGVEIKLWLYNYMKKEWIRVGPFKMVWWLLKGRTKARIEISVN